MVSNSQVMDTQRSQYIPGPPPPPGQSQSQLMHIPPPPPRLQHGQPHGNLPPPPPLPPPSGLPPGTVFGIPSWQSQGGWGRSGALPPPPPMINSNQAQNQHLAYSANYHPHPRTPAPPSQPPPPQQQSDKPFLSATFIPGGDSFGPGVGIPPLEDYSRYDSYGGSDSIGSYSSQQHSEPHQPTHSYSYPAPANTTTEYVTRENRAGSGTSNRNAPLPLHMRDPPEPTSPGPRTAMMQNNQPPSSQQNPETPLSAFSGTRHRANSAAPTTSSSNEAALHWPTDRVLIWLAANGFSDDWQETFRVLDLHGSDFLQLGRGTGGRGNLEMLHRVVYPKLQQICADRNVSWDSSREREEGKRMRKLIRRIADNEKAVSAGVGHRRGDSGFIPSASTDGTLEDSPRIGKPEFASPPPGAGPEGSPNKQYPPQAFTGLTSHNSTHTRSSTLPVYSKGSSSSSTPSDAKGHERSDYSRNAMNNLGHKARHSAHLSGDVTSGLGPRSVGESPGNSPRLSHTAPVSLGSATNVATYLQGHVDHRRGNSTESVSRLRATSNGASPGAGLAPDAATSTRFYESRRDGQEMTRPSPLDAGRSHSTEYEPGPGGKDQSKGFLSKFRHRKKAEAVPPAFEDHNGESPTSPASFRHMQIFSNQKSNASDTALLGLPSSAPLVGDSEKLDSQIRGEMRRSLNKRFILATPDHWNYRLIDVTDVETPRDLRSLICEGLGIEDAEFAQIYITTPGQTDHQIPLNDDLLIYAKHSRGDDIGSLKLYVRSAASSSVSVTMPNSAGLGLSFAQRMQPGDPGGEPMAKAHSAGGGQPASATETSANRDALLQRAAGDWKREAERKQKAYLESRQQRKEPPTLPADAGIRASRVVDFDIPRLSPFEDKKQENLVPLRKPPTAPAESTTLSKVNSLSKKTGERYRSSGMDAMKRISNPIAEEPNDRNRKGTVGGSPSLGSGIGAALANVGMMAGAPATVGSQTTERNDERQPSLRPGGLVHRGSSPGTSPRPEFTWSKGNVMFKNPEFDEDEAVQDQGAVTFAKAPNVALNNVRRQEASPAVSPSSTHQPPFLSRPSQGPSNEFQETHVSFATSPNPQAKDDSDDDSDDGLFAIPLANKLPSKVNITQREPKPALEVDTDMSRRQKAVAFRSPSSSGASTGPSNRSAGHDDGGSGSGPSATDRSFSDGSYDTGGPSEDKRRESFVSDIWAHRPAVENVVNNLDEFFPGVDLDRPYLEEKPDPESAGSTARAENTPNSIRGRVTYGTAGLPLDFEKKTESDTLGSEESTLKAKDRGTVASIAQRQVGKSGGLSRMKSIREVAKGRNVELQRAPSSVAQAQQQKTGGLLRRKSTKMFGANIVQIKPKPGNRLSTLDPIPQEDVPTEETPKRQATFKIIRGQLIGKGTYGRVYLGMNATTGEFLAVKQVEVNQKAAGQDKDRIKEMVAALDQEIDTMQHLEHPNIVQYLGCERQQFSISIYLEYISGGSVGSCLRKHGKFEEPVVRSLTRQTLEGLEYLHEQGILHRDLKADNILLDLDGTCKISDFGISKKTDDIYGNDITNSMQGSVFWMAPEVVRSQGQGYSAKVDIWSLGCVVLEMFAGKRPWSREEAIGAIFKLGSLNEAPPIPEDVQATASVDGLNFMYDCFQVNPSDRPTATTLLYHSTFCIQDPYFNFFDTTLAAKLRNSDVAPPGT